MPTFHRWLILPLAEYTDDQGEPFYAPKYVGDPSEDRLDGFSSGGPFSRSEVENAGYPMLPAQYDPGGNYAGEPEPESWRVVVAWGEDNPAWNALNEIHAMNFDTETLADHGQDVAPVMDDRFGPGEWSVDALALDGSENSA